jgi:3-oxoacyl-[acyl-carrier-protein] synthase II
MGALTSLGIDCATTWQAVLAGRSGVAEIRQFPSHYFPVSIGSEVDMELMRATTTVALPEGNRAAQFGIFAMTEAWQDAGLDNAAIDPWRAGVCIGFSNFGVGQENLASPDRFVVNGKFDREHFPELCRQRPQVLAQREISQLSMLMAREKGLHGVSMTVQTACSSAAQAIGEAMGVIRSGDADLMITGGADSMMSVLCVTGFTLLGTLAVPAGDPRHASRPFDAKRNGFIIGEGAGILIIEELAHALTRKAQIHGELIGYGSSSDGFRFTDVHPEGRGAVACMRSALADAGIAPQDVGYINAHGTATRLNDPVETRAIKEVFGDHAYRLAVSSTKSEIGHLVCAAGGIEAIFTVLAVRDGVLPPTINLEYPDPECDLDYIPNTARHQPVTVAISNSFGFGGQNGTLVVRRWNEVG